MTHFEKLSFLAEVTFKYFIAYLRHLSVTINKILAHIEKLKATKYKTFYVTKETENSTTTYQIKFIDSVILAKLWSP